MDEQATLALENVDSTTNPLTIMIIEDDQGVRELLGDFLDTLGYNVIECEDGESGLAQLSLKSAHIVLSDIRMHGMDGVEVLRRVRDGWPNTEVILITGHATVEAAVEALRHGAYDLLMKPIRLEQIEAAIRRCEERVRFARENRELRQVVDRLRELNSRKEKFVALANHELRTPTAVACGLVSLLKKKTENVPKEVSELILRTDMALGRLKEVVNDIGDLATSRGDEQWLKRSKWSLGEVTHDLEAICREYSGLRDVDLTMDCNARAEQLAFVDRPKLMRAVGAVIQNAVKFTPDGGRIMVRFSCDDANLTFQVTDSGVGIPPRESARIFDLFYKVGDPLSHHTSSFEFGGGGLGIGLPLARTIARAHGGDVTYRPGEESGSIFTLTVPLGKGRF